MSPLFPLLFILILLLKQFDVNAFLVFFKLLFKKSSYKIFDFELSLLLKVVDALDFNFILILFKKSSSFIIAFLYKRLFSFFLFDVFAFLVFILKFEFVLVLIISLLLLIYDDILLFV